MRLAHQDASVTRLLIPIGNTVKEVEEDCSKLQQDIRLAEESERFDNGRTTVGI